MYNNHYKLWSMLWKLKFVLTSTKSKLFQFKKQYYQLVELGPIQKHHEPITFNSG